MFPLGNVNESPTRKFLGTTEVKYNKLPDVEASVIPSATTVGHELPVTAPKVISTLLEHTPPLGAEKVVSCLA
jgi:hypothetical protein